MTSLITNVSAMTALQTLQSTNEMLDKTQNRISTGYRVSEAKDNAAYWSIATTMRSDNSAMSAVKDSLGIGAATVDTAYTGMNAAKDVLVEIKNKLTTATSDGIDRSKVQSEISALQEQLKTIAASASFSGQNWLSNADASTTKSIVSSLSRDINGQVSIGSIKVDLSDIRLFANGAGLLDKTIDIDQLSATTGTSSIETTPVSFADPLDKISFSVSQNGTAARTIEITQQTLIDAGLSGTTIKSDADLKAVYQAALKNAGVGGVDVAIATAALPGPPAVNVGDVSFTSLENFKIGAATASGPTGIVPGSIGLAGADTTAAPGAGTFGTAVVDIDISGPTVTASQIQAYIRVVDTALAQTTTAASNLGAIQNRVTLQTNFVSSLMDTITKGVGVLVDADMTEESTRLKALQTQQQLGVQSLSIANSSSQSILKLFQG